MNDSVDEAGFADAPVACEQKGTAVREDDAGYKILELDT